MRERLFPSLARRAGVVGLVAIATLLPLRLFAAEKQPTPQQTAEGLALFKKDVRLILAHHCVDCHGGTETEGELDMTTREGLLKGGDEGIAVVPFSAEKSRLVRLITHAEKPHMPEDKEKLPADEIAKIVRWINLGAPYDQPLIDPSIKNSDWTKRKIPEGSRKYWAFLPIQRVEPPSVKNAAWCRTPIDRFVMRTLEAKGLTPNDPVGRRKLIRRVYFDLIGLPPTPEEIETFIADKDPRAYEKLLDRLLASEHFGERWGSHWLDVARFAESHGFEQDYDRPFAFHYRDFVIKALNQDMPFNQFVRWQLAGDEIAPDNSLAMMATGFLGAGVFPTQITANEVERTRYDALDDMASTTGTAMLGLSIGCARCHDHKYDPIPSSDYYRLLSTFTTTVRSNIDLDISVTDPQSKIKPTGKKEKVMVCSEGFKPIRHHTQGADFFKQTYFLLRGDCSKKQGTAQQGFLQVLNTAPDGDKHWQIPPPKGWRTSYRRRALAGWITDTKYGAGNLLARVIVNRLWQHHTGRGIVATPNDFGRQGQQPTHPQLLDWLASELMRQQWRLKPLHKLMMTSAVYMQGTQSDAADVKIDPNNHFCWRRSPRRLEAEAIRDSMLAIGGQLDERMFGKGTLDQGHKRRSIYFTIKRSKLIPVMQLFDASQALVSIGQRPSTTIAPQALSFMNSPQVRSYADGFAKRLAPMMDRSPAAAVERGYAIALGRPPGDEERADMTAFLKQQIASYGVAKKPNSRHLALTDLCQVLFSLNEFVYPD
ncbi:MAG: PSD1 domain-containing protein [Planctomycetes bacterium]|nr:PSD1 domain-containing protein [Planctomycetota bacterium]